MGCSKEFLRRIYSNKLTEDKLDLLYTFCTELDLVVSTPVTLHEMKQYDQALKLTADEAKFENKKEAWSQLEKLEQIWKLRRKKYVAPDHDLQPQLLRFNF